ncbi:GNAT family N-acetyltransferase [Psychromicrobium lacuslunae]|uniref:Acetyltransferase n=1 Tax=Psychromicrobium lacuslunae TaxID=1618207 RepID=A0A0D4C2L0_9MICC|nr:GNAT family N-acetyltransferase [Psychromicrobium lacuslunae]AJT42779.1 acetyltransferase [Psychromicrobium lacuslunae]
MAKAASRVLPWSASPRFARANESAIRVLTDPDTELLRELVDRDPIANVFMASQLEHYGSAVPGLLGVQTIGYFDDAGQLLAACWVGSNVIPIEMSAELAPHFGEYLSALGRKHASIYGPADAVLGIFQRMHSNGARAAEVRACQPLMAIDQDSQLSATPELRVSEMADFDRILPAAAAMFEEEVGYSPYSAGEDFYRRRVASLIRQGHSFSHLDGAGEVIFKADLGAVSQAVSQVQGVWLRPELRGRGLSHGYMAAVVRLARRLTPTVSLYVNDYNRRAYASYQKVGFKRVGTFATVLF